MTCAAAPGVKLAGRAWQGIPGARHKKGGRHLAGGNAKHVAHRGFCLAGRGGGERQDGAEAQRAVPLAQQVAQPVERGPEVVAPLRYAMRLVHADHAARMRGRGRVKHGCGSSCGLWLPFRAQARRRRACIAPELRQVRQRLLEGAVQQALRRDVQHLNAPRCHRLQRLARVLCRGEKFASAAQRPSAPRGAGSGCWPLPQRWGLTSAEEIIAPGRHAGSRASWSFISAISGEMTRHSPGSSIAGSW